jgi:hypothetical protein
MTDNVNTGAGEMSTVTDVLAAYAEGGFAATFSVAEGSRLECHSCNTTYSAA